MIVNLSQNFVDNQLVCPDGKKSIEFVDSQRTGLYIKVTSSGNSTFYFRYKISVTKHVKLGSTSDLTFADAQLKVSQIRHEMALGEYNEPSKKKVIPTFSKFFEDQFYPFILGYKRSASKDLSMYNVRLKKLLGHKRLDSISRLDIERLVTQLSTSGELLPASINHHTKMIRFMLRKAVDWNILEKNNVSGISMLKVDNQVENILDEKQLRNLLHTLNTQNGKRIKMTCMVVLFLLSTGARLNEALSAKWVNIDRANRRWLIPAEKSKSGKRRVIPLNDSALDVLDRIQTENDYKFVFISYRTGTQLKSIHTGWKSLRNKAGLPHLRLHDMRHNMASMMANSGVSIYSISQVLGHSSVIVTQRYAHLSTKTLQDASQNAAKCINAAMAANS